MARIPSVSLALLLAFDLIACKGDAAKDEGADAAGAEALPDPPEPKTPASLLTGDKVTVPPVYKGLELGMTAEAAKALVPTMPEEDTIKDPAYPDAYFVAEFSDETQRLSRMYFALPGDRAKELITKQWGEPTESEELGRPMYLWFNPDAGLRASLKPGFGEDWDLELTAYMPYAQLLGADAKLAFEAPRPLLGSTAEQLREAYPERLVEKSQADAEADRKQLEAMVGDKAKKLGAPKPSLYLEFPPTEYEKFWTRVHLSFDGEGDDATVRRVWFMLPWELNPEAKDQIFAFLTSKWGEAEKGEALGETIWQFSKSPRVEVKANDISRGWDIAIEAVEAD